MNRRNLILSLLIIFAAIPSFAQIFYKIEGNGLKGPSYLFGTHHLAPASIVDSYPSIAPALKEVGAIVGELDMTQSQMEMAMAMQKYMMAPADSTISRLTTPEEFKDLDAKFAPYAPMPGISLAQLDAMRPMVISAMVTMVEMQKSLPGFNPNEQLDAIFQLQGKEEGKKIIPLESPEMQAQLLYTFTPVTKQLEDLKEVLNNPAELTENCQKLNKAYTEGDLDALLRLTESDDSDPAFMEALLTTRNHNWIKVLPGIINDQPAFIAVGALHLAGKDGLVELLRNDGYTVTPIK